MTAAGRLDEIRRQWRANARLRQWTAVAAAVLCIYVFLVLSDLRIDLARGYTQKLTYMRKLRALAGQPEWLERAQAAARLRKGLEAQIATSATLGLAQAEVQGWARERAAALGGQTQIAPQTPAEVDGQPGLWRVPVLITGSADSQQVVQLMQAVEKGPMLAVVDRASLLNRENRTFSLTIVFYYRIAGSADDGS